MKKYISILWLALLMPAISAQAGQIVTDSIDSKILKSEVKYNVYLPDGYEISSATFPVVYLLHGFTDTYTAWKEKGNMQIVVDELIGTGEACKMVIVMPNAGGPDVYNTWNGYFNMPGWNYEDFFFQEFLPAVESKYHAGGSKHQRAIMGLSMGGGGSVVYSQRHPEMFSSCYAMSPWLDNKFNEVDVEHMPKDRVFYVQESVSKQSALDFVDNADEAALQNLRSVAWFVDCGDDDFLFDQSVAFHQKMRNRGVHSELRVRNGVHNWEYWHLALRWALPFASRNFRN
jgi:S-formylglutathione hydrolase FrmB